MRRGSTLLVGLVLLVVVGAVAAALFYKQTQSQMKLQMTSEGTSETGQPPITPYPTPTPGRPGEAVVVFEAQGSIPTEDLVQLQNRVVQPILDYYESQAESGKILTVTVSPNTGETATGFPYTVKVIFDTGVNMGLAVERQGGDLGWWYPQCLGPCPITAEFEAKYPQISALVNQ